MYHLYILRCADDTLYTGITTDVDRRLAEHNGAGRGAKYTQARRPVRIVYTRRFRTRSNALREEARIKKLSRSEKCLLIETNQKRIRSVGSVQDSDAFDSKGVY